jgi:hypothetical protein
MPWRRLFAVAVAVLASGCADLTDLLPPIQGTYTYVSSSNVPLLDRRGTITIADFDRRSARFEGTYQYVAADGASRSGSLLGAFMRTDRIWFRFLDEQQLVHEGDFAQGQGEGEIFFLGVVYETTGATFSLRVR